MSAVERSRVSGGVSAVLNVLPFTAPRRSPGCGLPTLDFGTTMVIVSLASKVLPGRVPSMVSVGTPTTRPTTAVVIVPYSKVATLLASVVMPTYHCWPGEENESHTILHLLLGGMLVGLRLDTFIVNMKLLVPRSSATEM